jgi:hypothetical protein
VAGNFRGVFDYGFRAPDVSNEIVPTQVLGSVVLYREKLAALRSPQGSGLVLELDDDGLALLLDPEVDVQWFGPVRNLDGALQPDCSPGQASVDFSGQGVLEVGLRVEDGAMPWQRPQDLRERETRQVHLVHPRIPIHPGFHVKREVVRCHRKHARRGHRSRFTRRALGSSGPRRSLRTAPVWHLGRRLSLRR